MKTTMRRVSMKATDHFRLVDPEVVRIKRVEIPRFYNGIDPSLLNEQGMKKYQDYIRRINDLKVFVYRIEEDAISFMSLSTAITVRVTKDGFSTSNKCVIISNSIISKNELTEVIKSRLDVDIEINLV